MFSNICCLKSPRECSNHLLSSSTRVDKDGRVVSSEQVHGWPTLRPGPASVPARGTGRRLGGHLTHGDHGAREPCPVLVVPRPSHRDGDGVLAVTKSVLWGGSQFFRSQTVADLIRFAEPLVCIFLMCRELIRLQGITRRAKSVDRPGDFAFDRTLGHRSSAPCQENMGPGPRQDPGGVGGHARTPAGVGVEAVQQIPHLCLGGSVRRGAPVLWGGESEPEQEQASPAPQQRGQESRAQPGLGGGPSSTSALFSVLPALPADGPAPHDRQCFLAM